MTVFDTPADATVSPWVGSESKGFMTEENMRVEIANLNSRLDLTVNNFNYAKGKNIDYQRKIENVRGLIMDEYDMNGKIDENLSEVARMLDIELTKEIVIEGTISFTCHATVPMGFDESVIEFSVDISDDFNNEDCNIEIDNFEWEVESD